MIGEKDLNVYLSKFLDDKDVVNLSLVDKNFESDDLWQNRLKELNLETEPFIFIEGYLDVKHIPKFDITLFSQGEYETKITPLEPMIRLQKELKDNVNKFNISDYKNTYIHILQFNKLLSKWKKGDLKERCQCCVKLINLIEKANAYEKFYYTKVLNPIILDDQKSKGFFCGTGLSKETRDNMQKNTYLYKIFNARVKDYLEIEDDFDENELKKLKEVMPGYTEESYRERKKDSLNPARNLLSSKKEIYKQLKMENNFEMMIELLMDNKNYELW